MIPVHPGGDRAGVEDTDPGPLQPVVVTTAVAEHDLSNTGLGFVVWQSVKRGDPPGGVLMAGIDVPEAIGSCLALAVSLLRWAGHHHRDAHNEVRDGTPPPHGDPVSRPWLSERACTGQDAPMCGCEVVTACRLLEPALDDTVAAVALSQVCHQFERDRTRSEVTVMVSLAEATILVEAAALLVARRWPLGLDEVARRCQAALIADAA